MFRSIAITAVSTAALFVGGAIAQDADSSTLSGDAAFGGWEEDAPGVTRLITADDLPEPGATESASNPPEVIGMPEGAMPDLPEGFIAELVVQDLENPRVLVFAPNGDLFVANSEANEVLAYRFEAGSATPVEEAVFANEGLDQPYGIAFYPPGDDPEWVYVGNADGAVRFPYASGDLEATGAPETILEGIPAEGHWTRDIVFSPDGETMYYAVGSESNVGDDMVREPEGGFEAWADEEPLGAAWGPEERRAAVLAFDPDGSNQRYYASGLRNCSGMALQPATNQLWCVVNERDGLGDNLPFDYATAVEEGAFYGWPWYYIGDNPDPRWSETPREDLADDVTVPDVMFQTHSAPLNIAFYDKDAFGDEYRGDAFVALHGSWNREIRTGYKVVRLPFDESNEPAGSYQDFMTGFLTAEGEVWGRPVGVAVSPDGALFVSEDGNGTIWKVSRD